MEPSALTHLTPRPPSPIQWTCLFSPSYNFLVDALPIPPLVDAFNGVVVGQFKKRVEKLLNDSILLWRL